MLIPELYAGIRHLTSNTLGKDDIDEEGMQSTRHHTLNISTEVCAYQRPPPLNRLYNHPLLVGNVYSKRFILFCSIRALISPVANDRFV